MFPVVGELNAYRKNFRFDFEEASGGQYGECKFDVLFKDKRARVKEELSGVIARDYLYFNKQYKMKLSNQELKKYQALNHQYLLRLCIIYWNDKKSGAFKIYYV
ncbi:hypothetical protein GJV85_04355 [Sulfurimonas aquatica]|uniref:Uncharacterized protein n=1 Tax=Sulfurimonas aquatica TaxID=2672570 RepID=A0A975AZG6_9BACT|nr:endonuclease [Sulfurimonas aquatica]QSZ41368.1 hypothetical protein GJV85_04355 [Sulfurimonas aquatica]